MPTKKPPEKPERPPWTVTIRQAEDSMPCSAQSYFESLALIKSSPVPDGDFIDHVNQYKFKVPKKSRYGPDDPIPLKDLIDVLSNEAIEYLAGLLPINEGQAIYRRADEIERSSTIYAVREILSEKPKGKKK